MEERLKEKDREIYNLGRDKDRVIDRYQKQILELEERE